MNLLLREAASMRPPRIRGGNFSTFRRTRQSWTGFNEAPANSRGKFRDLRRGWLLPVLLQ